MTKTFIFIIIILRSFTINAQSNTWPDFSSWDPDVLNRANTAIAADYMTEEEKMVIFITNLARMNGPLFARTILDPYLEGEPKTKYTKSLHRDLQKLKSLKPLFPEKDLYNSAFEHAVKSGKKGTVGHQDFDKRFKPLMGKYNRVAENCAYGHEKGSINALQLLIDEGVSNLGHRKNMLEPQYNSVGVSIQPHKSYNFNCVMDFGKKTLGY